MSQRQRVYQQLHDHLGKFLGIGCKWWGSDPTRQSSSSLLPGPLWTEPYVTGDALWVMTLSAFQTFLNTSRLHFWNAKWPVCAKSLQACPALWDPMDCSLPGSAVCGILQIRILGWVSMLSSRGSSWPRDWTPHFYISCTGRQFLYH